MISENVLARHNAEADIRNHISITGVFMFGL